MSSTVDSKFLELDLGTGSPTYAEMDTIEVEVSTSPILKDFGNAFVMEAERKAPLKAEKVNLTADEVVRYAGFLLKQRVLYVKQECKLWRKLKVLWIPAFIQFALDRFGKVVDRQFGLELIPCVDDANLLGGDMSYEEAVTISEKIAAFESELQILQDAMPRSIEGDADVMTTALIAGYVRSMKVVKHVASTYITAFLNLKLKQEVMFKALYRVQYDDIKYIQTALTTQKVI